MTPDWVRDAACLGRMALPTNASTNTTTYEAEAKSRTCPTAVKRVEDMEARKTSRRRSVMDNSRSMQPRSGWTWKVWVGIVVGLAVVAGLIVLIAANAGGGSGGGGSGGIY